MGDSFYKSKRWKRMRVAVLSRDGYQCQVSKRYGKNVPANTVHHIFPADDYPQYRLESWNLISVCTTVHDELHDRTTRSLTDKGRELMERVARQRGMEV